jgi:hypothetical protein
VVALAQNVFAVEGRIDFVERVDENYEWDGVVDEHVKVGILQA